MILLLKWLISLNYRRDVLDEEVGIGQHLTAETTLTGVAAADKINLISTDVDSL